MALHHNNPYKEILVFLGMTSLTFQAGTDYREAEKFREKFIALTDYAIHMSENIPILVGEWVYNIPADRATLVLFHSGIHLETPPKSQQEVLHGYIEAPDPGRVVSELERLTKTKLIVEQ